MKCSTAVIYTRAQVGITAPSVAVEVHIARGLPALSVVGLPEAAVKESKDRVRSALLNSGFDFPRARITVNLAPADLPKEGGRYDLPIALGILIASGQLQGVDVSDKEFLGELALTGDLRPVRGLLPASVAVCKSVKALFVPKDNAAEAALPENAQVRGFISLLEVCAHLTGTQEIQLQESASPEYQPETATLGLDLADVAGQFLPRRALEIAAAGGHSLLLYGAPGSGKTMLASRLPGILPPLNEAQALEVACVYSVATGQLLRPDFWTAPFRSPHHTASAVALVGGGSKPKPGEISLAHHGVLFLDEFPEFHRKVREVLREPLESGEIAISRAAQHVTYPAAIQLIAAMNPCPCGYYGVSKKSDPFVGSGHRQQSSSKAVTGFQQHCSCSPDQIRRYRGNISGPLLDRIDLHVEAKPVDKSALIHIDDQIIEPSHVVRARVLQTRKRQLARQNKTNAKLTVSELKTICALGKAEQHLLDKAMDKLRLSARAYHRVLKVSRTLADMAGSERLEGEYLLEAIGYRNFDRPVV